MSEINMTEYCVWEGQADDWCTAHHAEIPLGERQCVAVSGVVNTSTLGRDHELVPRKPHWEEMAASLSKSCPGLWAYFSDDALYRIIESFEDWQSKHPEAYIDQDADSLHQLQSAVRRVEDIPFAPESSDEPESVQQWCKGYNAALKAVRDALEGPDNE